MKRILLSALALTGALSVRAAFNYRPEGEASVCTDGNAYTDVVYMPIDPKKALRSVTLETWSNETVIGLKSLAIGRDL